ncbi:MAG: hypothetical protein IT209_07720 [Armatimonadetes bacterium]|nr:hypothetical protein [Armatimonadota bacterium]
MFKFVCAVALTILCLTPAATEVFRQSERASIVDYWTAPGRYVMSSPNGAEENGPWEVRLTPEASRWFHTYRGAVGAASLPPGQAEHPEEDTTRGWEQWVERKLAYDRWEAQADADRANEVFGVQPKAAEMPARPGSIPPGLLKAAGNPPPLAAAVARRCYTVTFDDGESLDYTTHVGMRERFAYYRFDQGTVSIGQTLRNMPAEELDELFAASGMTDSEQRIARAVSRMEGGFESVNTYDTGYVSVGFIQFITQRDGTHSLMQVLETEKERWPAEYARDFHRFGIEVGVDGVLTVVDPETGAELSGADAVSKVIDDKRLIAVFQRAGRHSVPFRAAQILVAKAAYWPTEDTFSFWVNGRKIEGKVSDVIHSEAGIATLFDRKVNRGNINPFAEVLQKTMETNGLTSLEEAASHEREIVSQLAYREDFLKNSELSQPD